MAWENPYFEAVAGGVTVGANRTSLTDYAIETRERREELVEEYAWAIPNWDAAETIAAYSPVVEVGAGTGYWAWCIEQVGGEVYAFDPAPPRLDTYHQVICQPAVDAIEAMQATGGLEDWSLFLCWPPFDDPMAVDALDAYDGTTVIYVGEGRTGPTATDAFHDQLYAEYQLAETVAIPTYLGLHDRLEIWNRANAE